MHGYCLDGYVTSEAPEQSDTELSSDRLSRRLQAGNRDWAGRSRLRDARILIELLSLKAMITKMRADCRYSGTCPLPSRQQEKRQIYFIENNQSDLLKIGASVNPPWAVVSECVFEHRFGVPLFAGILLRNRTLSQNNQVRVRANGPLLCSGDIEVYDADGQLLDQGDDIALCRCGHSHKKPFCDGSHRDAGFEDDGVFEDPKSEPLQGDGAWKVTVRKNAMLLGAGPVTISGTGSCSTTRNKVALCRCGHSANKPFCDAQHRECGFTDP